MGIARSFWRIVKCIGNCLPEALVDFVRKLWRRAWKFLDRLYTPILLVASFLLLLLTSGMFSLLVMDLAAAAKQPPPLWAKWCSTVLLDLPGIVRLGSSEEAHSATLGTVTILVSIWAIVVPLLAYRKYRIAVKATRTVEISPIFKEGKDDVLTLANLLKDAKEAIIFAGKYDWLIKNDKLKEHVSDLATANSIVLVSDLDYETVDKLLKERWDDKHEAFRALVLSRLVESQPGNIRLTIARYASGDLSCCTMVTNDEGTAHATKDNMIVRSRNDDGRVLLNIINTLCDIDSWKDKIGKGKNKRDKRNGAD